ncbi:MAG: pentapeptide repeat-containing protein [Enhygromyxa sp.]
MSHTRVAVVQFDFHPAALIHRRSPLEDPIFDSREDRDSLLPSSGVPESLREPLSKLRARVRREHGRQVMLKLAAVFERCRAWGVQLVLLPEYSLAPELLPELAGLADGMVVVAGTHAVERARVRAGFYEQFGWSDLPSSGQAIAPVLHRGRLLALQAKLNPARPEQRSLVAGDRWAPVEWDPSSGPALPGPLGVMICLDFLYREQELYRSKVGPALERARFLAVPSYTPWHSRDEFAAKAWEEARRYGRPVLWANVAAHGGSSIFVDEGQVTDLRDYPRRVGLLEAGDEGVVVADVNLGFVRVGTSTRPGDEPVAKPFAVASLVYRHHPVADRFASWLDELEQVLARVSVDDSVEMIEDSRTQLVEIAALAGGQARSRRIRRLLDELDGVTQIEELRQFTREVVLPESALPLEWLRKAWADGAAQLVFEWMGEHRGAGLEQVEQRLREAGRATQALDPELWTEQGLAAMRATREAVVGETDRPAPVVEIKEIVPAVISLRDHDIEDGPWVIRFRATPEDFRRRSAEKWEIAFTPDGNSAHLSNSYSTARSLWLLQRAQGHLDATCASVEKHEKEGTLLVCVRAGEGRQLIGLRGPWLEANRAEIERVAASCKVDVRMLDVADYEAALDELVERFNASQPRAERVLSVRLAELGGASARVRVKVHGGEQPEDALEALDAWADSSDRAALLVGPFGLGKSTLLARWTSQRWQRGAGPLPIVVDLATATVGPALGMLLAAAERDPASEADRAALSLLIEQQRLIACFDGFDEMVTRINFASLPERLAELFAVAGPTGRVLVATRDHYFTNLETARAHAGSAIRKANVESVRWLHLQSFEFDQVETVVDHFIPDPAERERVLTKIRSTYDLEDLVETPMLLAMVLQTIDELDAESRVGSATVYERYLERFLDHTESRDPDLFSREQKRAFAEVLAAELWRTGEASLGWQQLHKSVLARMLAVLPTDTPPEAAFLEIQGGSFFVWEQGDRFRFAHKSFLEFFMAKALLAGLERDVERTLDTHRITPEVAAFVAQLLRARGTGRSDPAIAAVQSWLRGSRSRGSERAGAAANALRLLRDVAREHKEMAGWVPPGADLTGVMLDEESLAGLDLREARLDGASLSGCDLEQTDLRGASLVGARMTRARLFGTRLDEVEFVRADLLLVEARDCSLRGARFVGTNLRQSSWTGCAWEGVRMHGVATGPTCARELDPSLGGLRPPSGTAAPVFAGGHRGPVTSVAWSPDGTRLASSSWDNTVRVWDAHDGTLVSTLQGHEVGVTGVAWSPDGTRLASSSDDKTVRVWDAHDGTLVSTLQGHEHGVSGVAWSPDGTRLASSSRDNTVRVWDAHDGTLVSTLQGHEHGRRCDRGRPGCMRCRC